MDPRYEWWKRYTVISWFHCILKKITGILTSIWSDSLPNEFYTGGIFKNNI